MNRQSIAIYGATGYTGRRVASELLARKRRIVLAGRDPEKLSARGLQFVRPSVGERTECNRIIMDELVCSVFKLQSVAYLQAVIQRLKEAGCDAVVLGCTEIPLIINDANAALPTLDSTRLLARAALKRAIKDGKRAAAAA